MNLQTNYYKVLGVKHQSTDVEIKKAYYKLSFEYHPDKNSGVDTELFNSISEAYSVLSNSELRIEYDRKSKWGKDYNELEELYVVSVDFDFEKENKKYEDFKKNQVLNIIETVDNNFFGTIEYQRWVICKTCNGTGKDLKSKFVIKDDEGNVKGIFDSDDGCDFCEGSGKDPFGNKCSFCFGQGKLGSKDCQTCKGDKRILGKQKLTKIKLEKEKDETIIKHMGHFSKNEPGKVGDLILKLKKD
jgi:DnaJ-class molecular chaperone